MNNYTYTYACSNISNTIKMSGHSSLEKYTSHFIESVVCERELETEQRLQHIDPPNSSGYRSLSFPFSWAAQPGLYNNLTSTYFLRAFTLNSTPRQSRSPLISWYLRPDAPVIYTGAFLLLTALPDRRSIFNNLHQMIRPCDNQQRKSELAR